MAEQKPKPVCGIVMPISSIDGCSEAHWTDVHEILASSITDAGFEPNLVSNADDVGIIQKRIIENLYDNPVVVCDVSGKNPNVMFELGLRLAFDKPTIIVKDDKTTYSFDTAPIEHLTYPRDLRFSKIVEFKSTLAEKISKTHARAVQDPNFSTFLKHFGEFKVAKLNKKEVSGQEYILDELKGLSQAVRRLERGAGRKIPDNTPKFDMCLKIGATKVHPLIAKIKATPGVAEALISPRSGAHSHLLITVEEGADANEVTAAVVALLPQAPRVIVPSRR